MPAVDTEEHDVVRPTDRRVSSAFERHAQSAILLVVVAAMGWAGAKLDRTSDTVIELKVQQSTMSDAVKQLQSDLQATKDDRYRKSDADRDFQRIERRLEGWEGRLNSIESKVANGGMRK